MTYIPDKKEYIRAMKALAPSFANNRWVLFENGSVLILRNDQQPDAIGLYAREILEKYGHMTRQGGQDIHYEVKAIEQGWLVSSIQMNLYTIVLKSEISSSHQDLKKIGLHGLAKRHSDAVAPLIIFIEHDPD